MHIEIPIFSSYIRAFIDVHFLRYQACILLMLLHATLEFENKIVNKKKCALERFLVPVHYDLYSTNENIHKLIIFLHLLFYCLLNIMRKKSIETKKCHVNFTL